MEELNLIKLYQKFIGDSIRYFRKQKDWSQEYLAFKSNLNRTYIGSAERGEKNITIGSLVRITLALNITLYQLITKAEFFEKQYNKKCSTHKK